MRYVALATVAVLTFAAWTATAASESSSQSSAPLPTRCSIDGFRPWSAAVWRPQAWKRGQPPAKVIQALRKRLRCAPPMHLKAMKTTWLRDRAAFYETRRRELWRIRVTPFYGGGHWWAIPYCSVIAESGGDYYVGYAGAYGLISPTWASYGGTAFAVNAGEARPREQDLVAHRVYVENGSGAWTPFEGGQC